MLYEICIAGADILAFHQTDFKLFKMVLECSPGTLNELLINMPITEDKDSILIMCDNFLTKTHLKTLEVSQNNWEVVNEFVEKIKNNNGIKLFTNGSEHLKQNEISDFINNYKENNSSKVNVQNSYKNVKLSYTDSLEISNKSSINTVVYDGNNTKELTMGDIDAPSNKTSIDSQINNTSEKKN